MCGRFTKNYTWPELVLLYRLTVLPSNLQPSYNVCPTDPVDVIVPHFDQRELVSMRWGLIPSWWSKPLKEMRMATFNARADSVATKPVFKSAFKTKRCLMPVSGYYEWKDTPDGKQPYYFTRADGEVMTIAGVYDEWSNRETGERIKSCAMVITEANKFVSEVHDRMPVILEAQDFKQWERGHASGAAELMKPAAEDVLQKWPVSMRVNSSKAEKEDSSLIEPIKIAA